MKTTLKCVGGTLFVGLLICATRTGGQQPIPEDKLRADIPPPVMPKSVDNVPKSASKSIDQLIDTLESIRKQKLELDRQEKAIIEELKHKVLAQQERLHKIGVAETLPYLKKDLGLEAKPDFEAKKKDFGLFDPRPDLKKN